MQNNALLSTLLILILIAGCVDLDTRPRADELDGHEGTDGPRDGARDGDHDEPTTKGGPASSPEGQAPEGTTGGSAFPLVHDPQGAPLGNESFPGPLPVFEQRMVADRASPEPTVGVTPDGVGFFASVGFDGPAGLSRTELYRTQDQGASWDEVTPTIASNEMPRATFDPYLFVDPVTGRVFSLDTYLACHWLSFSDDEGRTWTTNPVACGRTSVHHQSIFVGAPGDAPTLEYPHVVYVCHMSYTVGPASCDVSLDGGVSFLPRGPVSPYPSPECVDAGEADLIDQFSGHAHASLEDGTIYHATVRCGVVTVDLSQDQALTWEHVVVDEATGGPPEVLDSLQPYVDTDSVGNAYMTWVSPDGRAVLSTSQDQGGHWAQTLTVSPPVVQDVRYTDVQAGDPGRVAISYIGHEGDEAWNAYVTYVLNALDHEAAVLATVQVNPPGDPLHLGECTGRCRGFYDFLDLKEDPSTGGVWMALVDMCHDECKPGGESAGGLQAAKGAVGVQVGGVGLSNAGAGER